MHLEWSEGNPAFSRLSPYFASLNSVPIRACPLCLRRWLGQLLQRNWCVLGHFLKVSGREERLFYFCLCQIRLWGYFLPQQLFNSSLVKHLSVYFAESRISPEALWNDFHKAEPGTQGRVAHPSPSQGSCRTELLTPFETMLTFPWHQMLFFKYKFM